jgi:hypothetical protein
LSPFSSILSSKTSSSSRTWRASLRPFLILIPSSDSFSEVPDHLPREPAFLVL